MKVEISDYPEDGCDRTYSVEVSDHDIFSTDETLAIVILPVLKKLREAKLGAPDVRNEDVPEELRKDPDLELWKTDENWHARWEYVLDRMIWSFEQIHPEGPDWESQFYTGEADFSFAPVKETDEFGDHFHELLFGPNHTLKFDSEGYQAYEDKIQEGLILFGRYYRGLWT